MQQYIPWGISALSLLVAFLSFLRGGRNDERTELQQDMAQISGIKESLLKANMKLDQVCSTTSETRADIKGQAKEMQQLSIRLATVERDLKTAFNYIEDLRKENAK